MKLTRDSDSSPVPGVADFLDRLDAKLAKRNARTSFKLRAWGELLETAGWCVALRLSEERSWLGERARRSLESSGEVPEDWLELQKLFGTLPSGWFRHRSEGVVIWAEAGNVPQVESWSVCLTRRESEVLHWLWQGKTAPEISLILGCAVRTVEKHVANLYEKLGVNDRASLMLANPGGIA
jgi:DNA-binding CsgD family transcriptional regulator